MLSDFFLKKNTTLNKASGSNASGSNALSSNASGSNASGGKALNNKSMDKEIPIKKQKNIYTILDFPESGQTTGEYHSNDFTSAAKKALTRLSKHYNIFGDQGGAFVKFWLKDITPGSKTNGKEVCYIGTRVELFKPNDVNIKNTTFKQKYSYIVTKFNKNFEEIK
jgi:hypothetical protein